MDHTARIIKLAQKHDWYVHSDQQNICLLIFRKGDQQVNVYWSKMTVATVVNHPKQGRQQLYRKNCSYKDLENIFNNPRFHTGKGYRVRRFDSLRKFFGM
jgi:hypothetical protein